MSPEEAVADYILNCRAFARAEMSTFEVEPSLRAAIRRAALCLLPNKKRHPHQYRIPGSLLEQAEARLQAIAVKLRGAGDFTTLHGLVNTEISSLRGISELTIYDIAHRIGAYLKKAPQLIYLHRGTRVGAAVFGLPSRTIRSDELPAAFSRLTPAEIEDCLCIYKDHLKSGQNGVANGVHRTRKVFPCPPQKAPRYCGSRN